MEIIYSIAAFILIMIPGVSGFYATNLLIYSVGAMGKHADIRKMGINSLIYWAGSLLAAILVMVPLWLLVSSLRVNNSSSWVWFVLASSAGLGLHAIVALAQYIYKTHVKFAQTSTKKNYLQKKLSSYSKSKSVLKRDFVFGFVNSGLSYLFNLPVLIGAIVTVNLTSLSGTEHLSVLVLLLSSPVLILYFLMYFGVNLGGVERFRKKNSNNARLISGTLSWTVAIFIILLALA